jgi:hypothetical protein
VVDEGRLERGEDADVLLDRQLAVGGARIARRERLLAELAREGRQLERGGAGREEQELAVVDEAHAFGGGDRGVEIDSVHWKRSYGLEQPVIQQ